MSKNNPYNGNNYYVVIGLDTSYKANDDYAQAYTAYTRSRADFANGLHRDRWSCQFHRNPSHSCCSFPVMHRSPTERSRSIRSTGQNRLYAASDGARVHLCIHILAPLTSKLLHLVGYQRLLTAQPLVAFGYLYFCVILTFFSLIRRYKVETLKTASS